MTYTLGINAAFHDSAACLVHNGEIVAASEEERFTRIKHGKRPIPFSTYKLPFHAIDFCLRAGGIVLADVDDVAYSFDPWQLLSDEYRDRVTIGLPLEPSAHPTDWDSPWEPLFLSSIVNAPRHLASGAPHHIAARFAGVTPNGPFRWHWVDHHLAHAASAFLVSPFDEAAVMTLDGRGERLTTGYYAGCGTSLRPLAGVSYPHSLGLLYEAVTAYLGFLHSSDEYKVMALASFGRPAYRDELRSLITLDPPDYTIAALDLESRFGPPRRRGEPLEQRHYDLARSLQDVLEEVVLELAGWLHDKTGLDNLCLAGGVALNCVLNARLRDFGPFRSVWVQPAAGDAGTALGAAVWIDSRMHDRRPPPMNHVYLGPAYDEDEIESFLHWSKLPYRRLTDIPRETAELLAGGRIVGWFQGQMEFGPRALGARSILASPCDPDMQARLNEIKDREDFRPVAPAVLAEDAGGWFRDAGESPFMLFVHDIWPDKADRIPAVRHVDGTARIQTVTREQNPLYHD
ncbi:MAG TPA: carbamoyltransferase N-terminal domain-containing protein, partial [Chloroflexota bacterium]|nr:carbamoyltransferase N-terminal domain-containing protein [Chloroflexota bacterium]